MKGAPSIIFSRNRWFATLASCTPFPTICRVHQNAPRTFYLPPCTPSILQLATLPQLFLLYLLAVLCDMPFPGGEQLGVSLDAWPGLATMIATTSMNGCVPTTIATPPIIFLPSARYEKPISPELQSLWR